MKFPVKILLLGSLSAALIALQWSGPTFSEGEFGFILFCILFEFFCILLPVKQVAQLA